MDPLFAPLGLDWRPVSPRLATRTRILTGGVVLLVTIGLAVALAVLPLPAWAPALAAAAGVGTFAFSWPYAGRRARAWGYAERAEDLYIKHGVLVRSLVAVPYGRMQYVDVTAGPLERALGLAQVQLHTATPGTSAVIPGLDPDDAARLRDRLTALGHAQAAGL